MVELLYSELTYKIIGILYKVHNKLGPTYKEKYYQRAVEKVVLETKAINRPHPKYFDQALSYMNTLQAKIGLIANFKKDRLELKRLLLPNKYLKSL